MPNTFTGLVLFVLLLAPGFVFLLISERGLVAGREVSALRETAALGLSSIVFDTLAVLLALTVAKLTAIDGPDLGRLVAKGSTYAQDEYGLVAGWFVAALLLACLLAACAAGVLNRTDRAAGLRTHPPFSLLFRPTGGTQYVSAWWKILVDQSVHPDKSRYVSCHLDDGRRIDGWLYSVNHEAKDGPDRELVLSAPLTLADESGSETIIAGGAVTISASRMQLLAVRYLDPPVV